MCCVVPAPTTSRRVTGSSTSRRWYDLEHFFLEVWPVCRPARLRAPNPQPLGEAAFSGGSDSVASIRTAVAAPPRPLSKFANATQTPKLQTQNLSVANPHPSLPMKSLSRVLILGLAL